MARRIKYPKILQTRLSDEDYKALKEAFPADFPDSEIGREVVKDWLEFRRKALR